MGSERTSSTRKRAFVACKCWLWCGWRRDSKKPHSTWCGETLAIERALLIQILGIGQYTIFDPAVVGEADLGINFFLDEQSLGKSRAEQTCKLLQELNPDVQGHFVSQVGTTEHFQSNIKSNSSQPLETLISQPDILKPFSLIIVVAPVSPKILSGIVTHADHAQVPLFHLHCVGFYSSFSIHLPQAFPIVDTHPDPVTTTDLRLVKPWPELSEFATQKTQSIEQMDDHEHGHIPYALLLLHYLEQWKSAHAGAVPSSYKEKTEFREVVRSSMRTKNSEGGEENYDEAIAAVLKGLNEPSASSGVREVFASPECAHLTKNVRSHGADLESTPHPNKKRRLTPTPHDGEAQSANFWIIAHAISLFYNKHGVLPLPGSLPDMKAQSKDYIALQNIYKAKARKDAEEVLSSVQTLERDLGQDKSPADTAEVEAFCKNAAHIKLLRGRPFHVATPGQKVAWGDRARWAANALTDETSKILLHIAFLAWDIFCGTQASDNAHLSPPGLESATVDSDAQKLSAVAKQIIDDLLKDSGTTLQADDHEKVLESASNYCAELARAGGAELHNIASLTGGLVAQEVIKAITKQYVPVDNTNLFDGVRSETAAIRI